MVIKYFECCGIIFIGMTIYSIYCAIDLGKELKKQGIDSQFSFSLMSFILSLGKLAMASIIPVYNIMTLISLFASYDEYKQLCFDYIINQKEWNNNDEGADE